MEVDKKALYDLNIEKAILGCLIENPKFLTADKRINKKWFYSDLNRNVFNIIENLFLKRKPIDVVTLKSLSKDAFLIQEILDSEYSLSSYEFYIDILKEKYVARSLVIYVPKKIEWLHNNNKSVMETIGVVSSEIKSLSDELSNDEHLKKLGDVGVDVMKQIKEVRTSGVMPFKITTNLKDLNNIIPGYIGGDMVVIAGRPSSGKTSLMMQIAIDNARKDVPIGIISLEMAKKTLFLRQLSRETGIPVMRLLKGEITDFEWKQLANVWKDIDKLPIYIDDTSVMNEIDLSVKARKMKDDYNIEGLFIDYIQLLNSSGGENRQQEITKISRTILSISKELDIPVFALSQLNREVDKRENKRPRLADLRESGCLAGDSIVVDAEIGDRYTIKYIVENKESLLPIPTYAMDDKCKIKKFDIINAFYSGNKKVYMLTLYSGRVIKATGNHKFFNGKWTRLDELKIGDYVAVPSAIGIIREDKIFNIEYIGEEDTYDLTVDGAHNFVANDIIVHNSIEQDSSIVMMLYNPSYYGITEFEDGTPAVGVVEIGIEKFRNGGKSNIKVAFIPERMKFADLAKDTF